MAGTARWSGKLVPFRSTILVVMVFSPLAGEGIMLKRRLSSCAATAPPSNCRYLRLVVVYVLLLSLCPPANPQTSPTIEPHPYVPPELEVTDPNIKELLDSIEKSENLGNNAKCLESFQKALELATKYKSPADKAIVEDKFAVYYLRQGKLEDAKSQWLNSLSDGMAVSNLVLEADVLVALSALSQQRGDLAQSLKGANQALELARKSKSLYIESRALGELSRLQLLGGRTADARTSVEEALQIDRVNKYKWEAGHILYLAWVTAYESKLDRAIELAASARDLAVKNNDYITFIQASSFLGNAYVQSNRVAEGIALLERLPSGISEDGKPLFQPPEGYTKTVALPFFKIICLEPLAMAYEAGNRTDDALRAWQELYDMAAVGGVTLAKAESARKLADLYKTKKNLTKAIDYYALAAEASARAGKEQSRIEALKSEASLLFQQGRKDEALKVNEDLLPLMKTSKNVSGQFITDLVIAELLDGTDKIDRVESALKDAESFVNPDVTVPGVEPNLIVELYFRLADLYEKRRDVQHELIALEKAVNPAIALSSAEGNTRNSNPLAFVEQKLETKFTQDHVLDTAEKSYASGDFTNALVYFELLRHFDEMEAAKNNKYDEYTRKLNSDSANNALLQIPLKVISQDDGAVVLAENIEHMGPIANPVRLTILGLLTNYYLYQRPDMAVNFGLQALPSLRLGENDTPTPWDVAFSCELATALILEKEKNVESALEVVRKCMAGAKKLGIPQLLQSAHQTNVWVLDAAGKHDEAQESIQFLVKYTPRDPLVYVQLAQVKDLQADKMAAADAWRKAIHLYEEGENLRGAADAHLALANLLTFAPGADPAELLSNLQAADKLYGQLHSVEGEINAEASLGLYYAVQKNNEKSVKYFDSALGITRDLGRKDLEAHVLSQIGQAYEASDDLSKAIQYYGNSADLYEQQNDPANEAFQLKSLAGVLNSSHKPEEALHSSLKAKAAADRSNSWSARYWVRRTLAVLYGNQGQYQDGVSVLKEAKQISDDANQPLSSAWAALDLAASLETIGSWEEASEQINSAVPILQRFKDTEDESAAYVELMAIYGARESDLKDLDKALHFYQLAYQLVAKTHADRAAALNLDLAEIYWDQRRFKDAVAKASEALDYYKKLNNELGEASALISLAEAQRSDGDVTAAAKSLQLAEPLVDRAKNFYTLGRFYYGRAGLYRAQGRLNDAIGEYEQVIKMLEQFKSGSDSENRQHVAEHYDFIYDELIEAYYTLAQSDKQHAESAANKALEYAELNKARAFSNSWGRSFVDVLRHQVPIALQDKEATIANEREVLLSDLQKEMTGAGQHTVKEIEDKLAKLGGAESELQDQLRQTSPAYAEVRYPQRMNIQQIPLHPGELLVQFKVLPESTLVWLLSGTKEGTTLIAFYQVNRPRQWFVDRVSRIRDAFNGGHPEQFDSRITDELLDSLFPEAALQSIKTAKAIIFVPDDILFLFPFEMLSSHGQYLLLATPTEYFPSSAALRLARTSIHATGDWQESFIGIADPITSADDPRYQAVSLVSDPG
jgi:tetratricopeptide (TPR) repeat protein